jgi:hypothetical protein
MFDPQVVKKRQNNISGIEAKVISMDYKGMTNMATLSGIYGFVSRCNGSKTLKKRAGPKSDPLYGVSD